MVAERSPLAAALSGEELIALFKAMRDAEALGGGNAIAIRLMLALCVRKGAVWHLPAERTKTGAVLGISLTPQVVARLARAGNTPGCPRRRQTDDPLSVVQALS
jgi:hypothetical protein